MTTQRIFRIERAPGAARAAARRAPAAPPARAGVRPGAAHWLTPDLRRCLGAASAWGFAFSTFYLLPKYLAQELAAGPREIGLVVGTFAVATVVATPLAGRAVDRFPRRLALAGGSLLMAAAALGFVAVRSVGLLLEALRVAQGVSYALVLTAVGALVADAAPRERLSQALGLAGASMLVMNALAPAVAEPLAEAAGWPAAFAVAAGAALVATLLALRVREPAALAAVSGGAPGGLLAVLRQPIARDYAVVVALAGVAFGAVFSFEPPYALALGRTRVGGFFVAYATAAILVRVLLGHVPARLGIYRTARTALVLYALVVLALAQGRPALLEPLGALFGLAHGVFYPALNALAVGGVRRNERGRVMAIFTGAFSLGLAGGTMLLGPVVERAGYPAAFAVGAGAVAAALVVLARSAALRAAERPCD